LLKERFQIQNNDDSGDDNTKERIVCLEYERDKQMVFNENQWTAFIMNQRNSELKFNVILLTGEKSLACLKETFESLMTLEMLVGGGILIASAVISILFFALGSRKNS